MPKPRGREHSTLTETAALVVRELEKIPGIKMIAPGEIRTATRRKSGTRHLTIVHTTPGFELLITGQSVQKVAVHLETVTARADVIEQIQSSKNLAKFQISERARVPGV